MVRSYCDLNQDNKVLENRFLTVGKPVEIVSPMADDRSENLPIIRFSQIAFDSRRSKALLYFDLRSGPKAGYGCFVTLEKREGSWTVKESFNVWNS
jgi:hypothetical protein